MKTNPTTKKEIWAQDKRNGLGTHASICFYNSALRAVIVERKINWNSIAFNRKGTRTTGLMLRDEYVFTAANTGKKIFKSSARSVTTKKLLPTWSAKKFSLNLSLSNL